MNSKTRIAVLGGGYAGIEAAKKLHKHFKKSKDVEITLIDRNPYHTLMTELHEIAGSRTEPESVQINFKRIFSGTKVKVVIDDIEKIDFKKKKIISDVAGYEYDYIVIGTGGRPEFYGIDGIQQNAFTLWSLEDAIRIREHIEHQFRLAAKEQHENARKKQLTFVVAGAGFTGIELVGEIMERADRLCCKYHIEREDVKIIVIEAMDCILPILKERPRRKAQRYLEKNGVEILLNSPVIKGEADKFHLKDGKVLETKTFVWTGGVQGSEFTADIGLTKGKISNDRNTVTTEEGIHGLAACNYPESEKKKVGERGRIQVNEYMQSVDYPEVYLVGDMAWYLHEEKPIPQIVENALQSAETAAKNIIASMEKKKLHKYSPKFHGFMVSIGSKYAVASVTGINATGFFAMALKHLVNLHYLWGLAGFNACWSYLKEEFIDIKHRRSIMRGHTSARVPAFFIVPIRLWIGIYWLFEGINKIAEGWFHFDKSRSFWMFSRGVHQAGTGVSQAAAAAPDAVAAASDATAETVAQVADAVTAASGEVAETVNQAAAAASAASGAAESTAAAVSGAAQKFSAVWDMTDPNLSIIPQDSALVTWFRQIFMDGIAAKINFGVFQVLVVMLELALGAALLGGFFTVPVAAITILMCLFFTLIGLFSWAKIWLIFAAIALIGGAGRSFGIDHYLSPALGRFWNRTRFAKRTFLYAGEPGEKKRRRRKNKAE